MGFVVAIVVTGVLVEGVVVVVVVGGGGGGGEGGGEGHLLPSLAKVTRLLERSVIRGPPFVVSRVPEYGRTYKQDSSSR